MSRAPFTTFSTRRNLNSADDNGDYDGRHDNGDHGFQEPAAQDDFQEPAPEQSAGNSNDTTAVLLKGLLGAIKSGSSGNSSSSREVYDGKLPAASTFNPSTMDYKDWLRDILEQLGQLRYGIYWRQLTGDLPTPPTHNQNKFNDWVFRDKQMLTWLQSMFVDTTYYGQIRAINPAGHQDFINAKNGHVDDPALLAHGRAGQCLELIHTKHGALSDEDISNLEDTIAEQRSAGMALSTYTENARDLLRKTSNTDGRVLPAFVLARYMQGFAKDQRFTHAMVEVTKAMTKANASGCPLDFNAVSDLFVFWNNTLNPRLTKKPLFVNGKLIANTGHSGSASTEDYNYDVLLGKHTGQHEDYNYDELLGKHTGQHDDVAGARSATFAELPGNGGSTTCTTCTNCFCERPHSHLTADCFSYNGAMEATFLQDAPDWMSLDNMEEQLTKIIDLIKTNGKSPFTARDWETTYALPATISGAWRPASATSTQARSASTYSTPRSIVADVQAALANGTITVPDVLEVIETTASGDG
jgi:hypothetical protein